MTRTRSELDESMALLRSAPSDEGTLELIVARPAVGARELLERATLDEALGLVGDNWSARPSRHTDDGGPHPLMQLNVMSARVVRLLADEPAEQARAGDQLYLDLDLSHDNLPVGSRLALGGAVIEVTERPHNGCAKFAERFGQDAVRWVNSPEGRQRRLRGLNARVVRGGEVRTGDPVEVLGRGRPSA